MRILHTSDWHLGRNFGPVSLREDQQAFCTRIVEITQEEKVDLVIIAGDIYDRSIPPTESIELFRTTIRRLREAGAIVAAITGNHDSAERVASYDDFLDFSGFYLRGGYKSVGGVLTHEFPDGPIDIVLLPFLHPREAPDEFIETAEEDLLERRRRHTHESVLAEAIDRAKPSLVSPRSVAIAHAFVNGGATSESEQQLEVGGTGAVDPQLFEGFSYTALGHLHRPQYVGESGRIRYSGTPLSYSFSEDHAKSVSIVDLSPSGETKIETVDLGVCRGVTTLKGLIEELCQPGRYEGAESKFVRAIITDQGTVLDAKSKLEGLYPHVVEIRLEPKGALGHSDDFGVSIEGLSPEQAVDEFWEAMEGSKPDEGMTEVLHSAIETALERMS
jgi:exonuclease SbcD